jgi:exodeoxyribonuclease V gamma subunit
VLNLVKSNRMEILVQALAEVTARVPEDPLAPEWICVQSRGMKQWISLELAKIRGISAQLKFLFPGDLIQQLLRQVLPPDRHPDTGVLDVDALMWAVYHQLDTHSPAGPLAHLVPYFDSDETGRKKIQLARQIAAVLDDYQVYRPDMLIRWESRESESGGMFQDPEDKTLAWQFRLWQKIVSTVRAVSLPRHMAALITAAAGRTLTGLPPRISLFGLSSVPPSFMEVFAALDTDLFLFLLSPSNQYFFDMVSPGRMDRITLESRDGMSPDPESDHWEISHPLLASLGRSSRQFQALLERFDYQEPFPDLFMDPGTDRNAEPGTGPVPASMLSCLQSDILNLVFRGAGGDAPRLAVKPDDVSIRIHVCHSPMREVQVLKDLLLDAFSRDPEIAPHDVVVMMPDIEAYAPYIEAVFSRDRAVPFSISDRRRITESPFMEAFLKILDLKGSRLEQSRVMDLLLCPVIAETFDIAPGDIKDLSGMVSRSGILWGKDPDHRRALTGKGYRENTWEFGLERLFMGMAMPAGTDLLVNDVLPCSFAEGTAAEILGRFAHFCHTLFSHLDALDGRHTPDQWEQRFMALIREMMTPAPAREPDVRFVYQVCQELTRAANIAGFEGKIGFPAARDLLMARLDQTCSRGGFMTGGVSFCNLVPMRSIPFKVVALMGMDETAFPRKVFPRSFDLMAEHPRPGDKNPRDEDRTLFLEILLSARNQLIITYTGMSIKDNTPLPCSGVVSELADVLNSGFEFPSGFQWRIFHRLHPFHPAYFDPTPALFSYSEEQCRIACSRAGRVSAGNCPSPAPAAGEVTPAEIPLASLCRFFSHPLALFYQTGPEIVFPEPEPPMPDREPFQVAGLARYDLGTWILETGMDEPGYLLARAGGYLPFGNQGRLAWQDLLQTTRPIRDLAAKQSLGTACEPVSVDLFSAGSRVQGVVGDLYKEKDTVVRCVTCFGRIHGKRLIRNWILHLAVTLMMPETPVTTRIIGPDPFRRQTVGIQEFMPVGDAAQSLLESLVILYRQGLSRPWPFFPETGLALVRALGALSRAAGDERQEARIARAMKNARPAWFNPFSGTGEKNDRYTAVWTAGQPDPFDELSGFQTSGILKHSLAVFQPLLDHLETCP